AETLRMLGEVGRDITANLEASAVFAAMQGHVEKLLNAPPYLAIFRAFAGSDMLELACGWQDGQSLPVEKIALDDPQHPVARAARDWQEIAIAEEGEAVPGKILSALYVPLIIDQRPLGVMAISSHQARAFGEREQLIFRTLCGYAAIALDNANAYQRLQQVQSKLVAQEKKIISQEKMAALGGLVAGVAHELNTPLGNALMMANSLQDDIDDLGLKLGSASMQKSDLVRFLEHAQEASNTINQGLNTAVKLVNSFRQVAVDRSSEERRVFDLQQVCADAVATMADQISMAGHTIEVEIPKLLSLNSYPKPLAQVLTQLISNCLTHAFTGRSHGKMMLEARQESSGRVLVSLADNGIGLSETDLKRIFDPFFKVNPEHSGTGLGLSICSNIVSSVLNGHISANSTLGQGTTISFEIPLTAPEPRA
ncbi:MAG: GAF domain-containing sensor histidine kinase, partial [Burkholderiales bacterium]|nr:GAF domain-containing sensor histidine kinase [Burkholderiales bacterium]